MRQRLFLEHLAEYNKNRAKDFVSRVWKGAEVIAEKVGHPDYTPMEHMSFKMMVAFIDRYFAKETFIYRVAETFGAHLKKAKCEIKAGLLKMVSNPFFIEVPQRLFPLIDPPKSQSWSALCYFFICPDCPDIHLGIHLPSWMGCGFTLMIKLEPDVTLDEIALKNSAEIHSNRGSVSSKIVSNKDSLAEFVYFILKVILYIQTEHPDLVPEKGIRPINPAKVSSKFHENNCPLDTLRVGYSFHHRTRHVEGTMVSGHFRWQPCGEKLSKVKLIWIEEHERRYEQNRL